MHCSILDCTSRVNRRTLPLPGPQCVSHISTPQTIEPALCGELQQSPYLNPGCPQTGLDRLNSDSKRRRDGLARLSEKLRPPEYLGQLWCHHGKQMVQALSDGGPQLVVERTDRRWFA